MPPETPTRDALLEMIVDRLFADQRRQARWRWFWAILIGLYLVSFLAAGVTVGWAGWSAAAQPHAAVVKITGAISPNTPANAERIIRSLRAAADTDTVAAVVLDIDSPGGSPVQAERIVAEVKRLRETRHIPIVAVIGDAGASAAYYIASSADTIYAAKASVVGSIGVRIDSFGFTGLMQGVGVERRLFTAGENKGMLDMLSPVSESARDHIQQTLADIHDQFIATVRAGRGAALKDDPDLFSGLFWTGSRAQTLGLIDRIGDRRDALAALGLAHAIDYTPRSLTDAWREGLGATMASLLGQLGIGAGGLANWRFQ